MCAGLHYAFTRDKSFMLAALLSGGVLAVTIALHDWVDVLIILLATGLVLMSELMNTAIERVCDLIESRSDERIGHVKDVAAAAAGLCLIIWIIVLVSELIRIYPQITAALS